MTGFILLILAWILILPATIINMILVASKSGIRGWVKSLSGYFQNTARNIDIFGADEFRTLWNTIIVAKGGTQFKGDGKTISAYLGANQKDKTLTGFGNFVANVCDLLDKNHCSNAYFNEF